MEEEYPSLSQDFVQNALPIRQAFLQMLAEESYFHQLTFSCSPQNLYMYGPSGRRKKTRSLALVTATYQTRCSSSGKSTIDIQTALDISGSISTVWASRPFDWCIDISSIFGLLVLKNPF